MDEENKELYEKLYQLELQLKEVKDKKKSVMSMFNDQRKDIEHEIDELLKQIKGD